MSVDHATEREVTARLILACKEFSAAFTSWEAATHLDVGGGVRGSKPTAALREQIHELIEGAASMKEMNDELRNRFWKVVDQLASRGFRHDP